MKVSSAAADDDRMERGAPSTQEPHDVLPLRRRSMGERGFTPIELLLVILIIEAGGCVEGSWKAPSSPVEAFAGAVQE